MGGESYYADWKPPALTDGEMAEAREALAQLDAGMRPMPKNELLTLLSRLALHYWQPEHDAKQHAMVMADYAEDLADCPAILVREACRAWRRSPERWFPKVGQLLALIEPAQRQLALQRGRLARIVGENQPARTHEGERTGGPRRIGAHLPVSSL